MVDFEISADKNGRNRYELVGELLEEYKEIYSDFCSVYKIQSVKADEPRFYDAVIPKNECMCIFCGGESPDPTFKSKAHLIPECLGNKRLLSFRECDECNSLFSIYEGDLARYMGYKHAIKSTKQIKFKNPGATIKLNRIPNTSDINLQNLGEKPIEVLADGKKFVIPFKTHSFNYLNIWKLLVKIALSMMLKEDLANYWGLVKLISDPYIGCRHWDETHYKEIYQANVFQVPSYATTPIAILYKKKNPKDRSLTHTFQFYFHDEVWQIFLPMNDVDDWMYDNTPIYHKYCPPMLLNRNVIKEDTVAPWCTVIYANNSIKTHRVQTIDLPIEFVKQMRDKFRFFQQAKDYSAGIGLANSVKIIFDDERLSDD